MARRILIDNVSVGEIILDEFQAHHLRNVLRIQQGTAVEVFDKSGNVGDGILKEVSESRIVLAVLSIRAASDHRRIHLTIASAIPKAARADWMIEKCGELDVDVFIPLQTQRSVTAPEGKNKFERWERIATEASKQSHRAGVLQIKSLMPLGKAIEAAKNNRQANPDPSEPDAANPMGIYLSTQPGSKSLILLCSELQQHKTTQIIVFVGPEGGWTDDEMQQMHAAGFAAAALTTTILRIETAVLAAAAIIKSTI